MNATVTRARLMLVAILLLFLAKCLYAAYAIGGDFTNWIGLGRRVFEGKLFFSVYTGPAVVYAAFYGCWDLLFHSASLLTDQLTVLATSTEVTSIPNGVMAFAFWMKVPLLIADGITIWLIFLTTAKFTQSADKGLFAGLLYSSCPLVFLSEMITTVDIYASALMLSGITALWFAKNLRGALLLTLAILLRLAPLIFLPVYFLGYARQRKMKTLIEVFGTQIAVLALVGFTVLYWSGHVENLLFQLVPGEVLFSLVPLVSSIGIFRLSVTVAVLAVVTWVITSPGFWSMRQFGDEALLVLAVYFALSMFHPGFVIWMIPLLTVVSVVRGFGYTRYSILTLSVFVFLVVQYSKVLSGFGREVLLVPNMNGQMMWLSNGLYRLGETNDFLPSFPMLTRAVMSGAFAFLALWALGEVLTKSREAVGKITQDVTPNNHGEQPHAAASEEPPQTR